MTNLTPEQIDFTVALRSSSSGIALNAVAGSGKTTTLVAGVNELPASLQAQTLCVAFNKRNAEALAAKMPAGVACMTMNSMGHRVWMRMARGRIVLNSNKTWEIARGLMSKEDMELFPDLGRAVSTLKMNRVVPHGAVNGPQNVEGLEDFFEDAGFECELNTRYAVEKLCQILTESIRQAWAGTIDFDDQLYMPIINRAPFPKFSLVMVDEAQDLNLIQHEMLAQSLSPGGRLVAVGDPHQAIYGFRGAHSRSMSVLQDRFQLIQMPLSYCFRCSEAVIRKAQTYVPHIRAPEGTREGSVVVDADLANVKRGDALLSRYNRHLIPTAFSLIRKGIPAVVLGAEIGQNLARLVKRHGLAHGIAQTLDHVRVYCDQQYNHYLKRGKEPLAQIWHEKFEVIELIAEWSGAKNKDQLIAAIERLFSNQSAPVTLSTIHKAKGMEWPNVYFLAPELVPAHWARKKGGWELEQEQNIAYVGVTRAQENLYLVPEANTGLLPKDEPAPEVERVADLDDLLGPQENNNAAS